MTFSIITPSFKQLDWLRLCVASVRDQVLQESTLDPRLTPTFRVEHIIQDAGSPGIEDFAREIEADFYLDGQLGSETHPPSSATRHYQISIHCEKDAGMYDAINRGLSKSKGDICGWLNCDEQYLPGSLKKVVRKFSNDPHMEVLLGDALLVDAELTPVCYRRIMVPGQWHTRLDHLHSLSCAMFFRRTALPSPALNSNWKVIGDAVLMDYFLSTRKHVVACRELLSAYAFTGRNLSANPDHNEHALWINKLNWPPRWTRPLVVLMNRIRRLAHGAYCSFAVHTALYTPTSGTVRKEIRATVSGRWPALGH